MSSDRQGIRSAGAFWRCLVFGSGVSGCRSGGFIVAEEVAFPARSSRIRWSPRPFLSDLGEGVGERVGLGDMGVERAGCRWGSWAGQADCAEADSSRSAGGLLLQSALSGMEAGELVYRWRQRGAAGCGRCTGRRGCGWAGLRPPPAPGPVRPLPVAVGGGVLERVRPPSRGPDAAGGGTWWGRDSPSHLGCPGPCL